MLTAWMLYLFRLGVQFLAVIRRALRALTHECANTNTTYRHFAASAQLIHRVFVNSAMSCRSRERDTGWTGFNRRRERR